MKQIELWRLGLLLETFPSEVQFFIRFIYSFLDFESKHYRRGSDELFHTDSWYTDFMPNKFSKRHMVPTISSNPQTNPALKNQRVSSTCCLLYYKKPLHLKGNSKIDFRLTHNCVRVDEFTNANCAILNEKSHSNCVPAFESIK